MKVEQRQSQARPSACARVRLSGVIVGDVERNPAAAVKYGYLFDELARSVCLVNIIDASLAGHQRWWNAARTFHPRRRLWKERFYKNVPAFRARSRQVQRQLERLDVQPDLLFQVGALLDARWQDRGARSVIYTDYTSALSARHRPTDRSPFNRRELHVWLGLENDAYHHATHVFARSATVAHSLECDYGLDESKVSVVGGGVNLQALPAPIERPTPEQPTLLFIGTDFYRKGGDLAIDAFARIHAEFPNSRMLFVTGDPVPRQLRVEGIEFMTPIWRRDEIQALYRQADIFILPSRLETWGDVVLEAMAFGLPCIVSGGEAMEEIVAHGVTGLVTPDLTADALAEAIRQLIREPERLNEMGRDGRRRVEDLFTWREVTQRMLPIIWQVSDQSTSTI